MPTLFELGVKGNNYSSFTVKTFICYLFLSLTFTFKNSLMISYKFLVELKDKEMRE